METERVLIGKKSFFGEMSFQEIEDKMVGQAVMFEHNTKSETVGEVLSVSEANGKIYAEIRIDKSRLPGYIMTEEEMEEDEEEEKRILDEFNAKQVSVRATPSIESCVLNKIE